MKSALGILAALGLLTCVASHADMLLVGNKSAHTLWVLDAATGEKLAELSTGTGPHEVEVSPDGRLAVVTNYGGGSPGHSLTVIDHWNTGREPDAMAFVAGR